MGERIIYRAVSNRCAVDVDTIQLPISTEEMLVILEREGFQMLAVDQIGFARGCLRKALYRRRAQMSEAPTVFDCSSFTKWCYGWRGIWLPRRSIQQLEYGIAVMPDKIISGDLIFASGRRYLGDPRNGVGHVGLATADQTVIHAVQGRSTIVEEPISVFMGEREFRGARRIILQDHRVWTFIIPPDQEVETSDDIRWIVLESLSWS